MPAARASAALEFEVAAAATEDLTFNAAVTALEPEYIDYDDKAGHIYDGNTMQRTPRPSTTWDSTTQRTSAAGRTASLRASITRTRARCTGRRTTSATSRPTALLDASIRIQPPEGNWALTLWGKNLTDELYSQLGLPFLGDLVEVWGPPRTYGVDFTYSF